MHLQLLYPILDNKTLENVLLRKSRWQSHSRIEIPKYQKGTLPLNARIYAELKLKLTIIVYTQNLYYKGMWYMFE